MSAKLKTECVSAQTHVLAMVGREQFASRQMKTVFLTPSVEHLTHIVPRPIWAWPIDLFCYDFFPIDPVHPISTGYIKSLLHSEYSRKTVSFAEIRAFCSFFGGAKSVHPHWK